MGVCYTRDAMKHVGADNLLLYALCAAATRAESAARTGLSFVRKALGKDDAATLSPPGDKATSDSVKSAGSHRRLTKSRPLTSE